MPFLPPRAPTFLPGTLLPHGLSGSHCEPPSTLQLGCHPLQEVFPDLIRQDPSPSPCWCLKQYLTRRRHFSPVNVLNCLRPQSIITCFNNLIINPVGFPGGGSGNEPACQFCRHRRHRFRPWRRKTPWRRTQQPPPVFLPGQSHGQRSLVGCSPQGHKESDTTEAIQHAQNPILIHENY